MEMVIVEINVPAISTSFDFRIPTGSTVAEVTQEIVRIFEQTQNNIKFDTDVLVLFDTVSHKDRKSTRLNSSHPTTSRMPSSA